MNKIKAIIFGWILVVCSSVGLAAENTTTNQAAATNTVSTTKDAFLSFVLDKAKTYTDSAEVAVSKAVDVVSAEAPLLVKEFLAWRMWMHGLTSIFPLILVFIGLFFLFKFWAKWECDYRGSLEKGSVLDIIITAASGAISLIGLMMFFASSLSNIMSFVQVLVAPRVYLVEEVIKVLK